MQHLWYIMVPIVLLAGWTALAGLALLSWRRRELGPVDGRLRPCRSRLKCVSTQDGSASALPVGSLDPRDAFERARDVVEALPRATLVRAAPGYAHYELTSPLFRFVDDVELLLDESARVIHVRSESRVGSWDLGANRRRVAEIRARYAEWEPATDAHTRNDSTVA